MQKLLSLLIVLLSASGALAQPRPQGGVQVGPTGGGSSFSPTITAAAAGELLVYNGSAWVDGPRTLTSTSTDEVAFRLAYTTNKASGTNNDTGLLISMTDTASPGVSLPLDVQVGGSSRFAVTEAGYARAVEYRGYDGAPTYLRSQGAGDGIILANASYGTRAAFPAADPPTMQLGVNSANSANLVYGGTDGVLALRDSTTAQKLEVSGSYTDASNYRRAYMTAATGATTTATFGCETAGTAGSNCDVVISPTGTGNIQSSYAGAAATPSYAFTSQATTGMWLPAASHLGFSVNGGPKVVFRGATDVSVISGYQYAWTNSASDAYSGAPDTGFARSAAGVIVATNGSTGGGALEFREQTAPSAPSTNNARLYAEDNGSGKTRLCVLFATGAAQCFATEP